MAGSQYQAEMFTADGQKIVENGQLLYLNAVTQPGTVTVQAGAPNPLTTFTTSLVFDSTASTGGLYAWTGTTYSKVGLATT